ncbi:hypothetical protein LJC23_00025 [Desulfovibrio sp. OttesenSCG-928-I05]|nr:hypothetical protein [Desulfovibrio sp. OttesenSCG-928-O18]MDL2271402.1 hypothetical protein [Desulfovibrio sp. OttesenSCG-928-I05]
MKQILERFYSVLGSPSKVACYLQYSDRQLRNIRKKVELGEPLDPRVELWIKTKHDLLHNALTIQGKGK